MRKFDTKVMPSNWLHITEAEKTFVRNSISAYYKEIEHKDKVYQLIEPSNVNNLSKSKVKVLFWNSEKNLTKNGSLLETLTPAQAVKQLKKEGFQFENRKFSFELTPEQTSFISAEMMQAKEGGNGK